MTILAVGTGQSFATISAAVAAAHAGDTIDIQAGTYVNDRIGRIDSLIFEGVGGVVHLINTTPLPVGQALLDVSGNTTLRNLSIAGATTVAGDGVGICYEGGNLLLNGVAVENNQAGLVGASDPAGTIVIDRSTFTHNGNSAGLHGNIDVGDIARLTIEKSVIHDSLAGTEITSRAELTLIMESRIYDDNANALYSIDLPNGGDAIFEFDTITKGVNSRDPTIFAYGEGGSLHAGQSVTVGFTTIASDRPNTFAYWDAAGVPFQAAYINLWGIPASQADRADIAPSTNFRSLLAPPSLDRSPPPPTDNIYPGAFPALSAFADVSGTTQAKTINFSGYAIGLESAPNLYVKVEDIFNDTHYDIGYAKIETDGTWHLADNLPGDGVHNFLVIVATDLASHGFYLAPITVDTTSPALTAGASVTGTTAATGIVLSGTATDTLSGVSNVELFDVVSGAWTDLGKATLSGGTWQLTAGHLAVGSHSFVAVAADGAGNYSAASAGAPVTTVAATPLTPAIQRIIGNVDGGVTLLGTAAANSVVSITDTTAGLTRTLGSVTTSSAGSFSLTSQTKISLAAVNAFSASATNAAGQRGASTGLFELSSAASDTLSGTTGQSDVFASFLRTGQDVINGFESTRAVGTAHDVVNLSGTGYGSYVQVAPHISGTASAVIQLDATRSITLSGISAASLQASDFRFS